MHEQFSSLGCDNVLPKLLDHSYVSTICSQPSSSHEFDFDVLIDNSIICDCNVDLGYEDNVFDMPGEKLPIVSP